MRPPLIVKLPGLLLLIMPILFTLSCKKDDKKTEDLATAKQQWVTGTWKQKDIQLAVSTSVRLPDGTKLPLTAGSSMLDDPTINALLGALFGGNPFVLTRDNMYKFNNDASYQLEGYTDLILPVAGSSGTWKTEVYSSVLALFPSGDTRDPHWINNITSSSLNLALTVNFPGLGDVPLNLILDKQ